MNATIRRINVVTQPYFEETEATREERKLERREKFFKALRQTILFTLGIAAIVVLRVTLSF